MRADKPWIYVAVVWRGEPAPQRWRTSQTLKQALFLARRNLRAGRKAWIEHRDHPASTLLRSTPLITYAEAE